MNYLHLQARTTDAQDTISSRMTFVDNSTIADHQHLSNPVVLFYSFVFHCFVTLPLSEAFGKSFVIYLHRLLNLFHKMCWQHNALLIPDGA